MSLGHDLASIRKEKNLSLEEIFEVTKIPVHTLKSIENDTLLDSGNESKTYLRSFVRSYAKALKISDEHILKALESTEAGIYDHDLYKLTHPESESEEYSVKRDRVEIESSEPTMIDPESSSADTYQEEIEQSEAASPEKENSAKKPTVSTVNWADMSKKVYASPAKSRIGLLLIIILLVLGLGTTGYFYGSDVIALFSGDDETINQIDDNGDLAQNDSELNAVVPPDSLDQQTATPTETTQENITPALPETLTVTLYAAYDKLEPVRVTSDFNGRTNPFWMDQGEAYYFDFQDSLQIRGQYSRLLLFFNGNLINNPRQNYFDANLNSIVITRDILSLPEYATSADSEFPSNIGVPPPDSVIYRIQF